MSNARYKFASVFVAALVVLSVLAGAVPATALGSESGFVGVPDANVQSDYPVDYNAVLTASDLEGSVMASSHAESLEVIVTTSSRAGDYLQNGSVIESGDLALVLKDDVNHDGREIGIDAGALRDALGYTPRQIYGTHEDGERWTREVRYSGGLLIFEVPHFSSNTITFSGTTTITATPATNGSSYSYGLSSTDSVSNFTINATGVVSTETDSFSVSNVDDGSTVSADIAGSMDPTNVSVTFNGEESLNAETRSGLNVADGSSDSITVNGDDDPKNGQITFSGDSSTNAVTYSGSTVAGSSGSISVGGNIDPTSETISVTAPETVALSDDISTASSDTTSLQMDEDRFELTTVAHQDSISGLEIRLADVYDTGANTYDVYLVKDQWADGNTDGTLIKSGWTVDATSAGWIRLNFPEEDVSGNGQLTFEFERTSGTNRKPVDVVTGMDSPRSGASVTTSDAYGYTNDDAAKIRTIGGVDDLTATANNGGSTANFGSLSPGESASKSISLTSSTSSVDFGGDSHGTAVSWDIDATERTATEDPSVTIGGSTFSHTGILTSGETATVSVSGLTTGSNSLDFGATGGQFDWTLDYDRVEFSQDPSIDVDGDASSDASVSGTLGPGESVTKSISGVTLADDTWTVSTTDAPVSLDISMVERIETSDVEVRVNGFTTSHAGKISNGSTVSLSTNTSWVNDGSNTVEVFVGDGSASPDAPARAVRLDYQHTSIDEQSVSYSSSKWSESYNVSKTFASDRSSATLTIPFDAHVAQITNIEKQINGGSWSSVSSNNYDLNSTTMTVDLGSVSTNDTVRVRTTGQRVLPVNGSITVTEPTALGSRLDSEIRFDSWSSSSYLSLGGSPDEQRIHYLFNESWSGASEYDEITSSGYNRLHVPGAETGSTARVSTIPVRVNAKTGEVRISVDNPSMTEPEFYVRPGPTPGDEVEYTYLDAGDGKDYILFSLTDEVVRDSGTANSPVTLLDDDSEERLVIQLDSDTTTIGDPPIGGDEDGVTIENPTGGGAVTVGNSLFIVFIAGLLAAVWWLGREFGDTPISTRTLLIAEAALISTLALETLSPASLVGGVVSGIVEFFSFAGQGVASAMPLVIVVLGVLGFLWLRNRGKPEKVVNFQLGGGSEGQK